MSFGQTATLSSGHKIPTLGFGTWQAAPGEVGNAVFEALKAGYRHLDLAKIYQNQKEVAQGLKKAFSEISGLKREDVFITSKIWNNSQRPELVAAALDDTLAELELEYLDLWLIHWPVAFAAGDNLFPKVAGNDAEIQLDQGVTLSQTWKAFTELPKSKVRSIGVSNYNEEQLQTIINDTGVAPAVNQVERHPRLQQKKLIEFHAKHNIHLTAYSPFGNNGRGVPLLFNRPEIVAVAERLSASQGKEVTAAQVILSFLQKGSHSVIPKSVTASRIQSNFQDVELDDEAIKALEKIGEDQERYNVPATYKPTWNVNIWDDKLEKDAKYKPVLKL